MIQLFRATKKWSDMTSEEMFYALDNLHYFDPVDGENTMINSGADPSELNRGIHAGEVLVYSGEDKTARMRCEKKYLEKCKEEGVVPKALPRWA